MINKHDFASAGVSIITPTEPGFSAELDKLGLGTNPDADAVRPFSAILQNSSKRSVVAFAVNWTITDIQGNTFSRAFNYVQPSALLDGGKAKREKALVEHQIRPGASRLITANGMARNAEELHGLAGSQFPGSVTDVALDLAVFDDGEAVGPNRLGLLEMFAAHVNAEQDLVQEVESRMAKGEPIDQILANIHNRLGPDTGDVPATPAALYDHNFRAYLNELETTARNVGVEGVRNSIAYRKYAVRPSLRRAVDPAEKGGR